MKSIVRDILFSASTTRQASSWFTRSFFASQKSHLDAITMDANWQAVDAHIATMIEAFHSCTRTFLDPIHVTAESRLQQRNRSSYFWWLRVVLVVSPSMPLFLCYVSSCVVCFLVLSANVSSCCGMFPCSVYWRFLLDPLTSALDPGAFLLSESSVLFPVSLASCFRVFASTCARGSWTGSCFPFHVYLVCCSNYLRVAVDSGVADRRPETVVAALCFSLPTLLFCTI
jgi:hypothetical protein